jgi:non-ribosomal peptide synthetase component F/acyl carrier protein
VSRTAGRDEIVRRLRAIWAEVLVVDAVDAEDDFFALGGTSVAAVQIAGRAATAFGVDLPANTVFTERTVAAYAAAVADGPRAARERPPRRIDRAALGPWEATVWSWGVYGSGTEAQAIDVYMLDGQLDVAALEWAFTEVVRRHENLRTVYPAVDHRPRARVRPAEPLRLPLLDLTVEARARRDQALREQLDRLTGDVIDYRVEPPLRVHLVRLEPTRHVLVVALHEIACDGQGYGALMRDLSRLYDQRAARAAAASEAPALQYRDAIHLPRDVDVAAGRRHWERVQAGAPLALSVPFASGGHQVAGPGESVTLPLPPKLVADVRALAVEEAATRFMAYGAAYVLLLHRWSGATDLIVESSAENRTRPGLEDVVGLFARLLPFRLDVSDAPSFRTLLRRMRDVALMAFHYGDELPIVSQMHMHSAAPGLNPAVPRFRLRDRTVSYTPTFAGVRVREIEPGHLTGALHLELLDEGDDRTKIVLASTDAGWAEGEIARMARHWIGLLARAVAEPDRPIGELDIGGDSRVTPRPARSSGSTHAIGRSACLHELVERQARRAPEAIAVRHGDQALDYRGLAAAADALARRLRVAGVGRGMHVGVALDPSIRLVIALLAVLKTGATCIPIATASARPELKQALPPLTLLLVAGAHVPLELVPGGRVLDLGAPTPPADAAIAPPALPGHASEPATDADVAFAIPTAGVAGPPRCVALTHGTLARLATWQQSAFRLGPGDRALHAPGPGVRAWAMTPWPYLAAGAEVVVPPSEGLAEPPAEITVAAGAPAQASRWLAAPRARHPCLRLVRVQGYGGLSVRDAVAREVAVVREYGAAEAGGVVLVERVRGSTSEWDGVSAASAEDVSIPLAVLDDYGNVVPSEAVGELCVDIGAIPARTGDLACQEADGTLRFIGRRVDEAPFRGFRLNPRMRAIEQALSQHPAIGAITTAWDPSSESLLACVVPRHGTMPSRYDLDHWVRDRVPSWVLPARYVTVRAVPCRADGSPDRRRLVAIAGRAEKERVAPRGATERTLLKLWRKVLRRRGIGVHDNFFVLGGTLVLGVELAGRAENAGIGFSPTVLFVAPTIAELAQWIDGARAQLTSART